MGHSLGNNYGKYYSFLSKPVQIEGSWNVDNTQPTGTSTLRGQGIKQVYMHSTSPGLGNPNPAVGYAIVELNYNYQRLCGGGFDIRSPLTGSALAINATALTIGNPYQILTTGVGSAGAATIAPVADVSGSLASTWFRLYDSYGNTFIIWFSVSGVGSAPIGVSGTLVQQSISTGATAATIGAALVTTIAALPSGISGVFSFTASGTTTVTVTSTKTVPLAGPPADGAIATGFTFAQTIFQANNAVWGKVGVPAGILPVPGVGFIATATGFSTNGTSTGTVQAIGQSGIGSIEYMGDPNVTINPVPVGGSPNYGGYFMLQFLAPTSSSVTTSVPTAPTQLSKIFMDIIVEQATLLVAND
jgi:hypothetical protein